jgi:hypothetical protein
MMAEGDFGPVFWHLDGSAMDPDYPFSFYLTREEWEEEQRRYEEFSKRFNEEWSENTSLDQAVIDDDVIN